MRAAFSAWTFPNPHPPPSFSSAPARINRSSPPLHIILLFIFPNSQPSCDWPRLRLLASNAFRDAASPVELRHGTPTLCSGRPPTGSINIEPPSISRDAAYTKRTGFRPARGTEVGTKRRLIKPDHLLPSRRSLQHVQLSSWHNANTTCQQPPCRASRRCPSGV